jgi:hypothetical protein
VARAFERVAGAFEGEDGIALPEATRRAFGSNGIKVDGKLFALFTKGTLVLKLPAPRVAALIDAGRGAPFETGGGRIMKEWVALRGGATGWVALAREAHTFVAASKK